MSEQEMNSYRFASGIEPSDEMLAQIMREVAEEAKERNANATASYFAEMRRQAEEVKAAAYCSGWRERCLKKTYVDNIPDWAKNILPA